MNVKPPEYVLSVLRTLEARGFEAFLVGGCVRDVILGRRPYDWDVCTNARPGAVMEIFPHSHPTGIKHGTVTVVSNGRGLEVTTYRTDGAYADFRRPESVEFIGDVRGDLARRDFTMNAIAMTAGGELFDPFGGERDIAAGLIRCVGEPDKRFTEDALRMLRALRFSAVLGFEIEAETLRALEKNAKLIRRVSIERVTVELNKTLLSGRPETVVPMLELGVFDGGAALSRDARVFRLRRLSKKTDIRWAALCALLSEAGIIAQTERFLLSLRLDSDTVKNASRGAAIALSGVPGNAADWKRLLSSNGERVTKCAAAAMSVLRGVNAPAALRRVLRSGDCFSLDALAVSGRDLMALGLEGKAVGQALKALLAHVIESPQDNNRETLLALVKKPL